jgi:DNA-binding TFAR19-related protein (PDSD5 family)
MNWTPRKLSVIQQLRRRPMTEETCLQIKMDGRISHVITQKDIQKILHQVDEYSQRIPTKTLDLQALHRNYTLKD